MCHVHRRARGFPADAGFDPARSAVGGRQQAEKTGTPSVQGRKGTSLIKEVEKGHL
jgi:hypothetical protein